MLLPWFHLLLLTSAAYALWPIPTSVTEGNSTLWLLPGLLITYNGEPMPYLPHYTPAGPKWNSSDIVQSGVSRTLDMIFKDGLVPWMMHTRAQRKTFEPPPCERSERQHVVRRLDITQTGKDTADTFRAEAGAVDESYRLQLSLNGTVSVSAATSLGVLHGLTTLTQLFYRHSQGLLWYTPRAPVTVEDRPRFGHRGLLMDVSRNFVPVVDVLRMIDALAWNKMNRLHLHATDSQAWPLELPSLPEVASRGAYHPTMVYTARDLQRIQEHGAMQGVQVVVEVDMPGHTGSLAESHPELVVAYDQRPSYWWCAQPPCGALRLNNSQVDHFLGKLFDDLLPRVQPYTAYFHTGGDELNANDSRLDPGVGTNNTAVLMPLLQAFVDAQHKRVRGHGLIPMVWEELALDWDVKMDPQKTLVQSWLGTVSNLTAKGFRVIDSNYKFWYLDCGRGQWQTFDNGPAAAAAFPFRDWCDPAKSWQLVYSHDPVANLTTKQAALVAGGEVAAWGETIDATNLEPLVWPRACAAAEILWSGRRDDTGKIRNLLDAAPRLQEMRELMVVRGIRASPITQKWCTMMSGDKWACTYDVEPNNHLP